jgi:N-acetylmuramoyl-L-alanine amidase
MQKYIMKIKFKIWFLSLLTLCSLAWAIANPPVQETIIIAIDAGHGGADPGAVGVAGTPEKKITLAIAKKVAKELATVPGFEPLLLRDEDYYVSLRDRISKARKNKASLLISIHADAGLGAQTQGTSVYVLSEDGASNELSRWLIEQEDRGNVISGVRIPEQNNALATVLFDLSQKVNKEWSLLIADKVLENIGKINKLSRKKVQNAELVVLKSPDIPSILIETDFISNPDSEQKLLTSAYQDKLAKAIANGIFDFFETMTPHNEN